MSKFRKDKINPIDFLSVECGLTARHIIFDPATKMNSSQYRIIRQHSHDGSLVFTRDLLVDVMLPLLIMTSCFKQEPPDNGRKLIGVEYTVGYLYMATVFWDIDLPIGIKHGQKERFSIPVNCKYIYDDGYK